MNNVTCPSKSIRAAIATGLLSLPNLLAAEEEGADQAERRTALLGYIRNAGTLSSEASDVGLLAGRPKRGRSDTERTKMLKRAARLAQRPEEKKAIIANLRQAWTREALAMVVGYAKDPALKEDAEWAAEMLVYELRGDITEEVWALMEAFAGTSNPTLKKHLDGSRAIRKELGLHVRNWMFAGPYRMNGRGAELHRELHDKAFPPETDREDVPWKEFIYNYGTRIHQFLGHTGVELCAGYLKTNLVSPSAHEVRLEMTSDDSIKAWLNEKLVHDNPSRRSLGEWDRLNVPLKKGRNELLLKISNHEGKWGLGCRVLTPEGKPGEGLKVIPEE